ncbi:MAG: recombinase RecA [Deltaproteobacteria bacterium]|nr:recombinase RecA [Deltaproteobacteria bacterium]
MLAGNESRKAIEQAVGSIEKQFGKGAIMRLGEKNALAERIETIPTGALSLDIALGIGGLPRGRIVEIFGPESSGKTTLTLHLVAEAQRRGGVAAFIDAEHALDTSYAKSIGVKLEDLLVSQPDTGEQALEIVDLLVKSNAVDVIVVDSVAALTPKAEIEGEMGDSHVGLQARLMSQALRKLTASVARSKTMVVFINQLRMKIGVMFGNPETTTGGNALKFYSSVRLDIRRIASVKQGEEVVGSRVKIKVVKNKVAAPFRTAEFDVMFGTGISRIGDMIDLAVAKNIIAKTGAWFAYKEERLGQGRENAKEFLEQNPSVAAKIEQEVLTAYNIGKTGEAEASAESKTSLAASTPAKDAKAEPQRAGAAAASAAPALAANAANAAAKLVPKKPGAVAASK